MDAIMEKILLSAISAPSGDNAQPWSFVVSPREINLYLQPERDNSLYNYQQRAAYLALGAVIENICIAATEYHLEAKPILFSTSDAPNLTATISFFKTDSNLSPLLAAIPQRTTRRGKYSGTSLTELQISQITNCLNHMPDASVGLTNDPVHLKILSRVAATNDKLIFENRYLHEFLFKQIRWNKKEVTTSSDGLDIETFELNRFDALGFKIMSYWPLVRVLKNIGLPAIIGLQSEQTYRTSSGFGLVTVAGSSPVALIQGGRAMQRVWLNATEVGLSFQPIAGITCLIQRINHGGKDPLSEKQISVLCHIERTFKKLWNIGEDTAVMFFRVGHSSPPRARSLRRPLDQIVTEKTG